MENMDLEEFWGVDKVDFHYLPNFAFHTSHILSFNLSIRCCVIQMPVRVLFVQIWAWRYNSFCNLMMISRDLCTFEKNK